MHTGPFQCLSCPRPQEGNLIPLIALVSLVQEGTLTPLIALMALLQEGAQARGSCTSTRLSSYLAETLASPFLDSEEELQLLYHFHPAGAPPTSMGCQHSTTLLQGRWVAAWSGQVWVVVASTGQVWVTGQDWVVAASTGQV